MKGKLITFVVTLAASLALTGCSGDDADNFEPVYSPIELTANEACDLLSCAKPQDIYSTKTFTAKERFGIGREVDMEASGSIDVDIQVYPFYAYEGSTSSGDYYLVEAAITVHNDKMWLDPVHTYYSKSDDGYEKDPQDVYAFYFKGLDFECSLLDDDGNAVGEFPAGNLPTPYTTIESTTYTTGFSLGISGKLKVGIIGDVAYVKFQVTPQVSIKNTAKHKTAAQQILNYSDAQQAAFSYIFNNNINDDNITPLAASTTSVTFYQSWLWRVPETTDFSTQSYKLRYKTKETYGGFLTMSGLPLHDYRILTPKDKVVEQDEVIVDVTPPSRKPMGVVTIENREDGRVFVTDIKIFKTGTNIFVMDSGDNVYAPGDLFTATIDVGDYDITFRKGSSDSTMKYYKYSKGVLSVVSDQEVHLYTDYYFQPQ